jgi:hypothetical protein
MYAQRKPDKVGLHWLAGSGAVLSYGWWLPQHRVASCNQCEHEQSPLLLQQMLSVTGTGARVVLAGYDSAILAWCDLITTLASAGVPHMFIACVGHDEPGTIALCAT